MTKRSSRELAEVMERLDYFNLDTKEILNLMQRSLISKVIDYNIETQMKFFELLLKSKELELKEQGY